MALVLDSDQRAQSISPESLNQLSEERDRAQEKVHRLERELEAERLARKEAEDKRDALLVGLEKA
jgi:predicted transcriptional regulator